MDQNFSEMDSVFNESRQSNNKYNVSKQEFKNAQTSKNSKSTSRDKKKGSNINTFTGEKGTKNKKRQSIKNHGEVKKMITTHFLKPGFMQIAC